MFNFILMLLGLVSSHNNANATTCNNNLDPVTIKSGATGPTTGTGEDGGPGSGSTGGNTGQTPPPFTQP